MSDLPNLPQNPHGENTAASTEEASYKSYRGLHEPLHQGSHSVKLAVVASEDRMLRISITQMLENLGWQVIDSPSVQGSLAHISPATDAIFIDLEMNGERRADSLLKKVKAIHPTGQVVFLGTKSENKLPDGADFLLPCPPEKTTLGEIAKACQGTRSTHLPLPGARFG